MLDIHESAMAPKLSATILNKVKTIKSQLFYAGKDTLPVEWKKCEWHQHVRTSLYEAVTLVTGDQQAVAFTIIGVVNWFQKTNDKLTIKLDEGIDALADIVENVNVNEHLMEVIASNNSLYVEDSFFELCRKKL